MSNRSVSLFRTAFIVVCCASALAAALISVSPSWAASVPAWLDDAITKWNSENPGTKISFVDIRDSYVWYDVPKTAENNSKQLRTGINKIAVSNGYEPMDEEEKVTTGKPPAKSGGASKQKKCWSRSFVKNLEGQSNTKAVGDESPGQRQRLLTSLVCDDDKVWWAAFRVAD